MKILKNSTAPLSSATPHPVGLLIREYRLKANLSAADVARLTDVALEDIAALENGSLLMSLSDLYALCNVLNIPPSKVAAATNLKPSAKRTPAQD